MNGNNRYHAGRIIEAMQNLEEISGPDTIEDYVAILTLVKLEIDRRIATALTENDV